MEKQQQEKIIQLYSKRRSMNEMKRATGLSTKQIKNFLIDNQLWTGHGSLKSFYDEFFFDTIDTEEKAYWLGFIYADGYISSTNNTVGIELKSTDSGHLEKLRNSMQAEREVKFYHKNSTFGPQDTCRFQICSSHLKKMLLSYYKSTNKTFEGEFPKIDRIDLIPHLIRGFFDGDGNLSGKPKSQDQIFRPSLGFIGTKETLKYIEEISGFHWSWSQRFPERGLNNYQINCGRVQDCINFLNYMYKDATIYLDRKYQRYLELLENRKRLEAKARV